MARIRQIKPEFYLDDELAQCSRDASLLFPGLWMPADKIGKLADRPAKIRARLFPYDTDLGTEAVDSLISELEGHGFLLRRDGFIHITNWRRWQHASVLREHIPSSIRKRILSAGSCISCGSTERLTVDHKIPVSKGGSNEIQNLQCLCSTCNTQKSNRIIQATDRNEITQMR